MLANYLHCLAHLSLKTLSIPQLVSTADANLSSSDSTLSSLLTVFKCLVSVNDRGKDHTLAGNMTATEIHMQTQGLELKNYRLRRYDAPQ
jgi:hypothetical protein